MWTEDAEESSSNLHNSAAGSQQAAADAGAEDVETVVLFEEWLRRTLIPPATGSFPWSRLPRFGSKRAVLEVCGDVTR